MQLFYYRHNQNKPSPALSIKKFYFCELTIVFKGEMHYTINGQRITLKDEDAIFLSVGALRTREEVHNCHYVSFNFYSDVPPALPMVIHKALNQATQHILYAFDEIKKTTLDLSDERLKLLLQGLLAELEHQAAEVSENELVTHIKTYIQQNLRWKISLQNIADHVFFSVPHIEKLFKAETGVSIIHYLIQQRVQIAKNLLMDNTIPIKEVALNSGFPDCNFFSRTFAKYVGCSPSEYRKTHTDKE